MGKPGAKRQRKERESDKDTVVAYHEFLQGRIQGELNGVSIGPGHTLSRFAIAFFVFGFLCMIVGILVITLRHRHVYLISWDDQFLGPFFIIMSLLCYALATFLLLIAKRRTNQYRKDLAFRPIGDYGVAVVHKSKMTYDDQKRTELKSGTTPHNVRHPGRPGPNDRSNRGDYSKSRGYDNRGYKDDNDRRRDRERSRDDRDGRPRDGRPRDDRPRDDRPRGDRPRGDRPPGRDDDRERRPRPDGERRRDNRGRRGDDPNRPREPLTPEEEQRRREARRKYEEDKRRRYEEDKRRAELRKQSEAESYDRLTRTPSQERGIDVDPGETRTFQIQTTVKLSHQLEDADESAI